MANKFSQSIIDRLEQEAKQQKEAEKKGKTEPKDKTSPEKEPAKEKVKEASAPATPPAVRRESAAKKPDLSDYLRDTPRRQAKNKTFYLDEDLLEALKQASRQQGVAESRLVNDILRKVLGL